MSPYFPLFLDLNRAPLVVIGGNRNAQDKIEKLLPFTSKITVLTDAPLSNLPKQVQIMPIPASICAFLAEHRPNIVILADPSVTPTEPIYQFCQQNNIHLNTVDQPEYCTFFFPSLLQRGNLTVAISTAGASPAAAVKIKQEIESTLPASIEEILNWLAELRPILKQRSDLTSAQRTKIYRTLVDLSFAEDRPLNPEETESVLRSILP